MNIFPSLKHFTKTKFTLRLRNMQHGLDLRSSEMLSGVDRSLFSEDSGQLIAPILMGQITVECGG